MAGMLYVCATPIGNLEDITLRVLRVLKEVDVIAAEDTRQTAKLLNHYEIKTPLVSYHEHNKREKTPVLIKRMQEGESIALVTDAGTPAISDPGEELVRACYEADIAVTSLPGAAAVITALTLSGMKARRFTFEGFLPMDKKEREPVLARLAESTCTTVLYEAPHRLCRTLQVLQDAVGGKRKLAICKELTKRHETVLHFTVEEALLYFQEKEPKGEFVLVLEGEDEEKKKEKEQRQWQEMPLARHMELYQNQGMSKKEAMKQVAKDRGVSKRDIYGALLQNEEED
ncbi:MAG: 16S rRNA (cytidine(1402)-2'-O)-methyltransferase [Lachnospiraceae bacterium]|nr:16S rRNA (cytidine(1402)-2'-O)-methyltransferase [Lachnospiraceae bacterium]